MNVPLARVETFEGNRLPTYNFRGRECWIAADVGRALGYAHEGLVRVIRKDWADEMIEWQDFEVLTGESLQDFKATGFPPDERSGSRSPQDHERSGSRARHLLILYETGLNFVCVKTDKPLGRKLRRFLVERILPELRRGTFPAPEPDRAAADESWARRLAALEQRVAKLEGFKAAYTPTEAARLIGRPIATVHRWVNSGHLPSVGMGKRRLVTHATLKALGFFPEEPASPPAAAEPARVAPAGRLLPPKQTQESALRRMLTEMAFKSREIDQMVAAVADDVDVLPLPELVAKALRLRPDGVKRSR
jgi:excisionase family DNA binding protein